MSCYETSELGFAREQSLLLSTLRSLTATASYQVMSLGRQSGPSGGETIPVLAVIVPKLLDPLFIPGFSTFYDRRVSTKQFNLRAKHVLHVVVVAVVVVILCQMQ